MTFTTDPEATTVLSYGFNGMSRDADRGWCQYSYFVPDGVRRETETKILIVLGDDIGDYVLQGYADGGCDQEIDGVSCTVTRRETTLADVLDLLCRAYQAEFEQFSLGLRAGKPLPVSLSGAVPGIGVAAAGAVRPLLRHPQGPVQRRPAG